jgi:hypothetical protein
MYYRSQGYRYPRSVQIPVNYSGNAFLEKDGNDNNDNNDVNNDGIEIDPAEAQKSSALESEAQIGTVSLEDQPSEDSVEASKSTDTIPSASAFKGFGSSLLSHIGSEELLILALVFLLSDTDTENDVIWLLLLLLFIK